MIAFLGPEGSNGYIVAERFFGDDFHRLGRRPMISNTAVVRTVGDQLANWGVVPLENTYAGPVVPVLDTLWHARASGKKVYPWAEMTLPIRHRLIGVSGTELDRINRVISHPQALDQCRGHLDRLKIGERISAPSTSQALETVIHAGDPRLAAIASEEAVRLMGGQILVRDIHDQEGNRTRFLILGRRSPAPGGRDKTIVMFTCSHKPGAYIEVLLPLKEAGINLDLVNSIPLPNANGRREYRFYVEFEGHMASTIVREAVVEMRKHCELFYCIGSFCAENRRPA